MPHIKIPAKNKLILTNNPQRINFVIIFAVLYCAKKRVS